MHRLDARNLTTSTRFSKQVKPFVRAKNVQLETTGMQGGDGQSPAMFSNSRKHANRQNFTVLNMNQQLVLSCSPDPGSFASSWHPSCDNLSQEENSCTGRAHFKLPKQTEKIMSKKIHPNDEFAPPDRILFNFDGIQ